jgi:hypothetical protein
MPNMTKKEIQGILAGLEAMPDLSDTIEQIEDYLYLEIILNK